MISAVQQLNAAAGGGREGEQRQGGMAGHGHTAEAGKQRFDVSIIVALCDSTCHCQERSEPRATS